MDLGGYQDCPLLTLKAGTTLQTPPSDLLRLAPKTLVIGSATLNKFNVHEI